ncbi:MAG: LPXTG cell wall anchor domain-containing protein [Tyzzerella sp.]|nr:LPXTG cell wall anchor domain-containing protein [Tyzzerella sp.]
MKRFLTLFATLHLICATAMTTFAADGNVTYSGDAGEFIFAPGSDYSPTDLFPNFKDVMPGDSITQKITVRNDASNKVKVKIYMRSLGAHEDGESPDFLSQMNLRVEKSEDNTMAYMFDAAANETAQLTDWVCLGTLYSGGEVNLNVILDVPEEMDNNYAHKEGYLDWEFMIEEFPIERDDPKTGDDADMTLWVAMTVAAALVIVIWFIWRKKGQKKEEQNI